MAATVTIKTGHWIRTAGAEHTSEDIWLLRHSDLGNTPYVWSVGWVLILCQRLSPEFQGQRGVCFRSGIRKDFARAFRLRYASP